MSMGTALVVIVAIIAFASMRIARYNSRNHQPPVAPPEVREKAALSHEVEALRERIKVLERIATDGNSPAAIETRKIAEEIEALRDR